MWPKRVKALGDGSALTRHPGVAPALVGHLLAWEDAAVHPIGGDIALCQLAVAALLSGLVTGPLRLIDIVVMLKVPQCFGLWVFWVQGIVLRPGSALIFQHDCGANKASDPAPAILKMLRREHLVMVLTPWDDTVALSLSSTLIAMPYGVH